MSTSRSRVPRNTEASSLPDQSPFVRGGRAYGSWVSAVNIPIEPSASKSRIPRHAESPVIPPPTIRYRYAAIDRDRSPLHVKQAAALESRAALSRLRIPALVAAAVVVACAALPSSGA